MFNQFTLTDLEAVSTTQLAGVPLGSVAEVWDATYYGLKAVYCKFQAALEKVGSCIWPDTAAGDWIVDDDNDQAAGTLYLAVGAALSAAAVTDTTWYGWVLTAGFCPLVLVTDGSADAGEGLIGSASDGTWTGVAATVSVTATTGTAYNTPAQFPATCMTADTSNALAAGDALFHSVYAALPRTF